MIEYTAVILAATPGDRLYPLTSSSNTLDLDDSGNHVDEPNGALPVKEAREEAMMLDGEKGSSNNSNVCASASRAIPKYLLPIGGDPILARLLRTLLLSGFEKCIILTGDGMESGVQNVVRAFRNSSDKDTVLLSENMAVDVITLPESCSGSADALRCLYSKKSESELQNIIVMPGDLVVEGRGVFGWLVDAHRQSCGDGLNPYESSACMLLLSDVGENDPDGVPLKESAKAKKGSFAREEEEIEYIGVSKHSGNSGFQSNYNSLDRLVLKVSKVDVEEDEDFVGKTPKLVLPKLKITGSSGLSIRTDLMDLHVYVFSSWIRQLLIKKEQIISLQEDLVPLLISRQFTGISSCFGASNDIIDSSDEPFVVGAKILPRGPRIAIRCCTISSYLYACREIVAHAVESPGKMLIDGYSCNIKMPMDSTFSILDGSLQSKNNSLVLGGSELPKKVTIKNSTVGRNTKIGEKCKLNNVVIMDNVTIGNETILQNTIVSAGALIGSNCNLNDCQVGPYTEVPPLTKVKGEAIVT